MSKTATQGRRFFEVFVALTRIYMVLLGIAIFAILMASFFLRGILEGRREAGAGAKVPTANESLLAAPPVPLKSNLYKAPEGGVAPTMNAPAAPNVPAQEPVPAQGDARH